MTRQPALALAPAFVRAPAPRFRATVRGRVQGVGFRPFVRRLALEHGLAGFVRNDPGGVTIEFEGALAGLALAELRARAPKAARIDALNVVPARATGARDFDILPSETGQAPAMAIGPDTAPCADCLAELFDPADRRHRHAFISCTACGPRASVATALPYDRARTTMGAFDMCAACAAEYADPANRRHHAEPICCPACGPRLSAPIETATAILRAGGIVALKGLAGFQLLCDARDAAAVARLRALKRRDAKPFAVMVGDPARAAELAELDAAACAALASPARPIVLALRTCAGDLAPGVAPGLRDLGVMLPATPAHHLIFADWPQAALVATSANAGGEPVLIDDEIVRARFADRVDLVLGHDRRIAARADDSVVRAARSGIVAIRRARGFVPEPVRLAFDAPPILALGGHLKNTICVARGREAFVSAHIGDLDAPEARKTMAETARAMLDFLGVTPDFVAHDAHPDAASAAFAASFGKPCVPVFHHHAHVAAILAERGIEGPALGVALDGYGYGENGDAWGGELLRVDGAGFRRVGHLAHLALAGGDRAAREPWRVAAAWLHGSGRGDKIAARWPSRPDLVPLLERPHLLTATSSMGRWFDAVAGLLGICETQAYEGEAPMRLESLVGAPRVLQGAWTLRDGVLDLSPLLAAIDGREPAEGAELFHGTLIQALLAWIGAADVPVALAGGCFANRILRDGLVAGLAARGRAAAVAGDVPANDGGLSLGQAWVAAKATGGPSCVLRFRHG